MEKIYGHKDYILITHYQSVKILICGDRCWTDEQTIIDALFPYVMDRPTVIHGAQKGADIIGSKVASKFGLIVTAFHPQWFRYGLGAGPIRNQQMLDEHPDLVLAFHNDIENSKGTINMVRQARDAKIEVRLIKSE